MNAKTLKLFRQGNYELTKAQKRAYNKLSQQEKAVNKKRMEEIQTSLKEST